MVVWVEAEVLGMVEGTGVGREVGRGEDMVVVMVVDWAAAQVAAEAAGLVGVMVGDWAAAQVEAEAAGLVVGRVVVMVGVMVVDWAAAQVEAEAAGLVEGRVVVMVGVMVVVMVVEGCSWQHTTHCTRLHDDYMLTKC